jgi:damage-control phosphatase, subfamily I
MSIAVARGMRTSLDCLPCFARQAVDLVRAATDNPEDQERLARKLLLALTQMDWESPAPVLAQSLQALIRPLLSEEDPYREAKEAFNRLALAAYPAARARIRESPRPFETALRLAAAGNIVDLGARSDLKPEDLHAALEASLTQDLKGDAEELRKAIDEAERILYIADNTGEIVFDKLLLELLPREKITLAVRGGAVLNDATLEDAERVGLTEIVDVIDNGSDAPGSVLADCGGEFLRRFGEADVVIAKGQGNFETLAGSDPRIFFLLKVKCGVISRQLGYPVGDLVLHRSPAAVPPVSV